MTLECFADTEDVANGLAKVAAGAEDNDLVLECFKGSDEAATVRGRAPKTQVGLSRYSVTISCAMTAGGVCGMNYRRFRLTSVDTPFRGGSARSVLIRRL